MTPDNPGGTHPRYCVLGAPWKWFAIVENWGMPNHRLQLTAKTPRLSSAGPAAVVLQIREQVGRGKDRALLAALALADVDPPALEEKPVQGVIDARWRLMTRPLVLDQVVIILTLELS